ncbi:hypothetical protein, partial [Couchioplanes caeruleus]|uniref:hypothetical protein n=1 Tax=Couchioplanes caeruleus TaxID=56438 RepID=UPI001B8054CD
GGQQPPRQGALGRIHVWFPRLTTSDQASRDSRRQDPSGPEQHGLIGTARAVDATGTVTRGQRRGNARRATSGLDGAPMLVDGMELLITRVRRWNSAPLYA